MERNVTLDFVRGVAILGILLLNISAFGLPKASYLNPAWYGAITPQDAWTWAFLDLIGQVKFLTLFALLFGAGLQMLLPRGRRWIQSRLTLLVLLGFIHGLLFWDGDILLAYGLVGLICWRLVRDAPSVKSLFNTGVMLYLVGLGVLLLLGLISDSQTSRAWTPDASAILYEKYWKLHGGVDAISNRADGVGNSLLALGAQYGWQLAGMMLIGAALMRSGWLKGQFSLRHYRRTGFVLVVAIACVGRMALTNYLLQTLICTTLFYHLGLFMHFDRLELLAFVIPVWLANILFSVIWLRYFRQGPVEWLWRQLTLRAAGTAISKTSR